MNSNLDIQELERYEYIKELTLKKNIDILNDNIQLMACEYAWRYYAINEYLPYYDNLGAYKKLKV